MAKAKTNSKRPNTPATRRGGKRPNTGPRDMRRVPLLRVGDSVRVHLDGHVETLAVGSILRADSGIVYVKLVDDAGNERGALWVQSAAARRHQQTRRRGR